MLAMGAEMGHSQAGNNNAYAQDNETSWLDWGSADQALIDTVGGLVRSRLTHPLLHDDRFLTGQPQAEGGAPDVMWLRADGAAMTDADWAHADVLSMVLAGDAGRVAVTLNRGHDAASVRLPAGEWRVLPDGQPVLDGGVSLPPRSVIALASL